MAGLAPQQKAERSTITQARWRLLTDVDIDEILGEAKLDASAESKRRILKEINKFITLFVRFTDYRKDNPPSRKIEEYKRISLAVGRLIDAINDCSDAPTALAVEWDRVYQSVVSNSAVSTEENSAPSNSKSPIEELRTRFPGEDEFMIQAMAQSGLKPESPASIEAICSIFRSVERLKVLADKAVATKEAVQTKLRTKHSPRKVDDVRLGLVCAVAGTFEDVLNVKTTKAVSGHWLNFLAAMLSRCEEQSLSPGGAMTLWLKAEKWQKAN